MQVLSWRDPHAAGGGNVEMFFSMIHAHLSKGLRAGLLGEQAAFRWTLRYREREFASTRENGVSTRPESAQASGSGW